MAATEWIKAALILAERPGAPDHDALLQSARQGVAVLQRYLDTPIIGLWRDRLTVDRGFVREPAPASSFYHIIGALEAVQRAVGLGDRPSGERGS